MNILHELLPFQLKMPHDAQILQPKIPDAAELNFEIFQSNTFFVPRIGTFIDTYLSA